MEAVGFKIARIPKQLMRTPVIASALGKSLKPAINGIKSYSTVVGTNLSPKSKPITSFSSIWYE